MNNDSYEIDGAPPKYNLNKTNMIITHMADKVQCSFVSIASAEAFKYTNQKAFESNDISNVAQMLSYVCKQMGSTDKIYAQTYFKNFRDDAWLWK